MYVLFSIPSVFEVEILMLFLICNCSVKSTTSSVAIFQRASLPVLPSCKNVLLLGQACSAQLKLAQCFYKPTMEDSSLKFFTHLGEWEAETFFYRCWCHRAGKSASWAANCCCSVMCKEDPIPFQHHHIERMCACLCVCLHQSDISPQ